MELRVSRVNGEEGRDRLAVSRVNGEEGRDGLAVSRVNGEEGRDRLAVSRVNVEMRRRWVARASKREPRQLRSAVTRSKELTEASIGVCKLKTSCRRNAAGIGAPLVGLRERS
jgi:hypothetical protein